MSDLQLALPEALCGEFFENCSVSPHSSRWPVITDLRRRMRTESRFFAVSLSNNADSIRLMLNTLKHLEPGDRRIVFANDPIPRDLRATFPKSMHGFLQRVLPDDLICISSDLIHQVAADSALLAVLFGGEMNSESISGVPCQERFPEAGPGKNVTAHGLSAATLASAVDSALADVKATSNDRKCITSGILLLWDFLHESHEISQTMEGRGAPRTADYWHGIMHRREPDAGNSAYWFRRVGLHPAFDALAKHLDRWMAETGASPEECSLVHDKIMVNGNFDPFAVVDLSTTALRVPGGVEDRTLRRVQYLEILNLLSWSFGGQ